MCSKKSSDKAHGLLRCLLGICHFGQFGTCPRVNYFNPLIEGFFLFVSFPPGGEQGNLKKSLSSGGLQEHKDSWVHRNKTD